MSINVGGPRSAAGLLAAALEPIAGQVHFSPECHAEYVTLGFPPSPGTVGATQLPDRTSYLTSRGSALGQVPGEVVAAAFAVFNPDEVVPAINRGWTITDAATIRDARTRGAVAQLRRILGGSPAKVDWAGDLLVRAMAPLRLEGRPLFAGRRSVPLPSDPLARLWQAADTLREYRGDSHTLVWAGAGLDPIEIGLLSDVFWGLAPGAHTGGRGWTADQLAASADRLRERGLLTGDNELSQAGFELRAGIEADTDRHLQPALAVIGDSLDGLVNLLRPWGDRVKAAGGYLTPEVRFTWATTEQPRQ